MDELFNESAVMEFYDDNEKNAFGIFQLALDSFLFNTVSGQDEELTKKDFEDQFKLIQSELDELKEGLLTDDFTEQLDGCVDVLVTVFGFMQRLHNFKGVDLVKACDLIGQNNISKFVKDESVAKQTVEMYKQKGADTYYSFNEKFKLFVVRDSKTNKVKKPVTFKDVDLSNCFPTLQ